MMRRGKKKEEDEVEEMLKAAQDEMILKLSVDSHHRSRSGIDYLDPDLHSRFLSLKSQPSATKKDKDQIRRTRSPPQKSKDVVVEEEESTEDLMARFSSLKKTSLPSSSSSPSVNLRDGIGEEEEEEDEVEKLIQWAIDAARLDPSPPSDDDDDDDQSCDDDDGDNDSTKDNKS